VFVPVKLFQPRNARAYVRVEQTLQLITTGKSFITLARTPDTIPEEDPDSEELEEQGPML